MYKMPHFTEKDMNAVIDFMKAHSFITLIGVNSAAPVATQVPVLFAEKDGQMILRGHIMKHTDHYQAFTQNRAALAMFTGPHCYVSSSWYKERNIGSTWNYMTVHAKGTIALQEDEDTLQLITDLTHYYEDRQPTPETVEMMPKDYVKDIVKAIAAFELTVEQLEPIFKLSQNRSDESYQNIIQQLHHAGDHQSLAIAGEMIKRRDIKA